MARKRLSLRDVKEIIAEFGRLPSPEGDRDAFALRAQVAEELSARHQEIALERHEYTQRIRQMQREYDAIEAVADRAFGRGWGRRLASRPSASRVASRHAGEDHPCQRGLPCECGGGCGCGGQSLRTQPDYGDRVALASD